MFLKTLDRSSSNNIYFYEYENNLTDELKKLLQKNYIIHHELGKIFFFTIVFETSLQNMDSVQYGDRQLILKIYYKRLLDNGNYNITFQINYLMGGKYYDFIGKEEKLNGILTADTKYKTNWNTPSSFRIGNTELYGDIV